MKKYISSIVFFLFSASMLLGQGPYYVNLSDASGFDRSPYQTQLEAAAQEIIDVLPEEYQSQFKVFDFGFYLHNEAYIDGYTPAIEQAKLLSSQESTYYLLFAKETSKDGVYSKIHIEIELPRMNPNYPCVSEDIQDVLEIYVNSATQNIYEQNGKNPSTYDEAEIAGMLEFTSRVNHLFNCCVGTENITCDAVLSNRKIASDLSNNFIHPASQFVEFTNIENIQLENYEYNYIKSDLQISFDVRIQEDGFVNQLISETQNLTQDLEGIANANYNSNDTITFNVKVLHITTSSYDSITQKLQGTFVNDNVTSLPPINSTINAEPSAYYEEIVVVDVEVGVPPIILSRLRVEYAPVQGINSVPDDPNRPSNVGQEEFILPVIAAKIGQALLKRAMYASINVGVNVVIEVFITKYLGHDDQCTWSEALWSANITGWHLAVWAAEGAITGGMTSQVKQVVISALAQTATYVLTTDNFTISTALLNFGQGLAAGAAFSLIIKKIGSAYDNFTKKYLVSKYGSTNLVNMAVSEFEEVLVKFGITIQLGDDIFEGVQRWFRSWEELFNMPNLRVNTQVLFNTKNWSDDLFSKFKTAGNKNPDFYDKVDNFPIISKYYEEGFPIIRKNSPNNKEVELDMFAGDKHRPDLLNNTKDPLFTTPTSNRYVYNNTQYKYEPSNITSTPTGKLKRIDTNQPIHVDGEGLMYIVDLDGVIRIGGRGGNSGFAHPTLVDGGVIGGEQVGQINPNVLCAGMIKFQHGKIVEINRISGHFKPDAAHLDQVKDIFKSRFQANNTATGDWNNVFNNDLPYAN